MLPRAGIDLFAMTVQTSWLSRAWAFQQKGDALYYASCFADKTFNPFVPYPIVAFYVICLTLTVIFLFGRVNAYLNRHLPQNQRARIRLRPQLIR